MHISYTKPQHIGAVTQHIVWVKYTNMIRMGCGCTDALEGKKRKKERKKITNHTNTILHHLVFPPH